MVAMPATTEAEPDVETDAEPEREPFLAAGSCPFTVHDLERMPDDGRRYELIDGTLIVSPAPGTRHQKIVIRLGALLEADSPDGMETLTAPYAVRVSDSTELQPDVLVGRGEDFTDRLLPTAPLLAVEVLSPSTALHDLNTKKVVYERIGVPSYWIIDPDQPSMQVFELDPEGHYQLVAKVTGREAFEAQRPFPVRIVPTELLGRLADR